MPANPTTKKGLRTRGTILEAAARVFARDGYVEARMLDIASEAGLSTGGLYRYFDNKT
jgi:AcrR family transcriptional regulator